MLTGKVPKTFRMLGKLEEMGLYNNDMDVDVPGYLGGEDLRYYLDSLGPAKILSEEEEGRKQVLEGRTEWGGVTKRKVTMGDEQP